MATSPGVQEDDDLLPMRWLSICAAIASISVVGIALIILIGYHEVIEQGALITKLAGVSPWLTMWMPFALLGAFAFWRFRAVCFLVNPDRMEWLVERLAGLTVLLRSVVAPRRKAVRP